MMTVSHLLSEERILSVDKNYTKCIRTLDSAEKLALEVLVA